LLEEINDLTLAHHDAVGGRPPHQKRQIQRMSLLGCFASLAMT